MEREIIIIGCGGVGSWTAEFLTRQNRKEPFIKKMILIDHDKIEEKNLQRQNFMVYEIGYHKTGRLKNRLQKIDPSITIETDERKITRETDLIMYDRHATAIILTDNQESKNMIAEYFYKKIIGNCDHDFAEIKTELDTSDKKTWTMEGGYTSRQDIQSNIRTAQMITTLIIEGRTLTNGKFQTRVQTEPWLETDIRKDREQK